jgi:carboxyl-terminal processing protease
MYKFYFLFCLIFIQSTYSEELNDTKYPYYEFQEIIYKEHIAPENIFKWNSKDLFNAFLNKLDPYKVKFSQSDINSIKFVKENFQELLINQDKRKKILNPLYNLYILNNKIFKNNMIKHINKISIEDFNDNTEFQAETDNYPPNSITLHKRQFNFTKLMMLDSILEDMKFAKIKENFIAHYKHQMPSFTYDEFNYLLLDVMATQMDQHSSFFSPVQEQSFMLNFKGKLKAGLGLIFGYDTLGQPKITEVVEDGPAFLEGSLQKDDILTGFSDDGEHFINFKGLSQHNILDLLRGDIGESLFLSYLHREKTKVVKLFRDEVAFKEQDNRELQYKEIKRSDKVFGYITAPLFYDDFNADSESEDKEDISTDFTDLLDLHRDSIDGLVIDLRNNGGGSLSACLSLLEQFLSKDLLLQIRTPHSQPTAVLADENPNIFKKPLVVLINGNSASASEIFAGTIQEYGRGIIIGEPSYGKGTVQTILSLPLGQVKVTTSQFYLPSGKSTQEKGVVPDLLMPIEYPQKLFGEKSLTNYIPYSEYIPTQPHNVMNADIMDKLIKNHQKNYIDKGLKFLDLYYSLKNDYQYTITETPLNLEYRKEQLSNYYKKQLVNINGYFSANDMPLIKNTTELLIRDPEVNMSDIYEYLAVDTLTVLTE